MSEAPVGKWIPPHKRRNNVEQAMQQLSVSSESTSMQRPTSSRSSVNGSALTSPTSANNESNDGWTVVQNHRPMQRRSVDKQAQHSNRSQRWTGSSQDARNEEVDDASAPRPVPRPWKGKPIPKILNAKLHAYGDSFVGPLKLFTTVQVTRFSGGSAKGLAQDNSKLQAGKAVMTSLDTDLPKYALFCFGNVDLQLNYFFKLRETFINPWTFTDGIAEYYIRFIDRVRQESKWLNGTGEKRRLFIVCAMLPVISTASFEEAFHKYCRVDWQLPKETSEMDAFLASPGEGLPVLTQIYDLRLRIRMIERFNEHLISYCAKDPELLQFVDINARLRNNISDGSVLPVHADYCAPDPTNIHIMWEPSLPFWVEALSETGLSMHDLSEDMNATLDTYLSWKGKQLETRDEVLSYGKQFPDRFANPDHLRRDGDSGGEEDVS